MKRSFTLSQAIFSLKTLLLSLVAGGITGVLGVSAGLSLSLLIFSHQLASQAPVGIGMALFSGFIINIVVALTSSFRGAVIYPQDTPAVIISIVIATMMAQLSGSMEEEALLATAIATITLTTLLMGVSCSLLGALKLGNFVRFIPYPVMGGFFAGTGWLLLQGSFQMLTERSSVALAEIPLLFQGNIIYHWLSGVAFALTTLWLAHRYRHWLILPACTVGAIGIFYLFLELSHTSIAAARGQGWLLASLAHKISWNPGNQLLLVKAHWPAIFQQSGNIASIILLSIISLLINASTIEIETKKDINLDRELQAVGFGNILASLGGGLIGFHGLHESVLSEEAGVNSRFVGLFTAAIYGSLIFFDASILSLFPRPILGGLILLLALEFLSEWLYDSWFKLPKLDYLTIWLILFVIAEVGFIQGVAVGLIVTVISFVLNYSRMNVAKHTVSGVTRQSNVDRSPKQKELLRQRGAEIYILELQGFIFFGTANNLLNQIKIRLENSTKNPLQFLGLDFYRVSGLDSSAVLSFVKIEQIAERENLTLIYTALPLNIKSILKRGGCLQEPYCQVFPDLDRGLEWCEECLLQAKFNPQQQEQNIFQTSLNLFQEQAKDFISYLIPLEVAAGEIICQKGDPSDGLYFLESGKISVFSTFSNGKTRRLRTYNSGTIIGEMGLYQNTSRSASVIADVPSKLYHLSQEAFERMERKNPRLSSLFHRYIVCLLSERLKHSEQEIRSLL